MYSKYKSIGISQLKKISYCKNCLCIMCLCTYNTYNLYSTDLECSYQVFHHVYIFLNVLKFQALFLIVKENINKVVLKPQVSPASTITYQKVNDP